MAMQMYLGSVWPVNSMCSCQRGNSALLRNEALEATAKVKRSSTGCCDLNCLIRRAAATDSRTNADFISSLVTSEAQRERGWQGLKEASEQRLRH